MSFASFMSTAMGRLIRIAAGIALITTGLLLAQGIAAILLIVGGAVPLLAGLFNVCVFAPLVGGPQSEDVTAA